MEQAVDRWRQPGVIVMDVYETLLDMSDVERRVNAILDSKRGFTIWFETFMQYCFADSLLDEFHDFISIAKATLTMTGQKFGRNLSEADLNSVFELLKHLPVHDEVQEGLSMLKDQGYRLAGLTNAPEKVVCDRMERTGLISYFEVVLSAEDVKQYKPSKKAYEWAAQKLAVGLDEMMMVSAHPWDIAGAANAGMQTVFINRRPSFPLMPKPDFICKNLSELASFLERMVSA